MKAKYLLLAAVVCWGLALLVCAGIARAGSATFSWLPNSETDLAGYKIHYGPATGEYTTTVDCGLPPTGTDGRVQYTVPEIPDGMTWFAATAYDTAGSESGYSDEVGADPVPAAPGELRTVLVNGVLQVSGTIQVQ